MSTPYGEAPHYGQEADKAPLSREAIGFQLIESLAVELQTFQESDRQDAENQAGHVARELLGEDWVVAAKVLYGLVHVTETMARNDKDKDSPYRFSTLNFGDSNSFDTCKKVLEMAAAGTGVTFTGIWKELPPFQAIPEITPEDALEAWLRDDSKDPDPLIEPVELVQKPSPKQDLYHTINAISQAADQRYAQAIDANKQRVGEVGNEYFGGKYGEALADIINAMLPSIHEETASLESDQNEPKPIKKPSEIHVFWFASALGLVARATNQTRVGNDSGCFLILTPEADLRQVVADWRIQQQENYHNGRDNGRKGYQ
jgi:hypothetical protein